MRQDLEETSSDHFNHICSQQDPGCLSNRGDTWNQKYLSAVQGIDPQFLADTDLQTLWEPKGTVSAEQPLWKEKYNPAHHFFNQLLVLLYLLLPSSSQKTQWTRSKPFWQLFESRIIRSCYAKASLSIYFSWLECFFLMSDLHLPCFNFRALLLIISFMGLQKVLT